MAYLSGTMQVSRPRILLFFFLLTIVNGLIFLFRDHFQYIPYRSVEKIYAPRPNTGKWALFRDDYPAAELARARTITSPIVEGAHTTADRAVRIAAFVYRSYQPQMGTPAAELLPLSPMQQVTLLAADTSQRLWCGNLAQIFAFYCWSQEIPTRIVEIMNPGDHHVVDECYIAEEDRWMLVDVTSNMLKAGGRGLAQFRIAFRKGKGIAYTAANDSTVSEAVLDPRSFASARYYEPDHDLFYYYRVDNAKAYTALQKSLRYVFPLSWYDIYSTHPQQNHPFYVKEIFLFLWVVTGAAGVFYKKARL